MTQHRLPAALLILQWVLALVIVVVSLRFSFSAGAARAFAETGLPNFVHATVAGGRLLIIVLAFAIVIHLLHGWFDVGALLVDAAAVWAVMTARRASAPHLERI